MSESIWKPIYDKEYSCIKYINQYMTKLYSYTKWYLNKLISN